MYWGGNGGVAGKKRPAHPTNPNDPAYSWGAYDNMVRAAAEQKIKVLFSIWGTPAWANKSKGLNHAPTLARDLRNFSYAAAKRYSGTFVPDVADPNASTDPLPPSACGSCGTSPATRSSSRRSTSASGRARSVTGSPRARSTTRACAPPSTPASTRRSCATRRSAAAPPGRAATTTRPPRARRSARSRSCAASRRRASRSSTRGRTTRTTRARPRRLPPSRRPTGASAAASRRPSCSATSRS